MFLGLLFQLGDADALGGYGVRQFIDLELQGGDPEEFQQGDDDDAFLGLGQAVPGLAEAAAQAGEGRPAVLLLLAGPRQVRGELVSVQKPYKLEMTRALLRTKSSHNWAAWER